MLYIFYFVFHHFSSPHLLDHSNPLPPTLPPTVVQFCCILILRSLIEDLGNLSTPVRFLLAPFFSCFVFLSVSALDVAAVSVIGDSFFNLLLVHLPTILMYIGPSHTLGSISETFPKLRAFFQVIYRSICSYLGTLMTACSRLKDGLTDFFSGQKKSNNTDIKTTLYRTACLLLPQIPSLIFVLRVPLNSDAALLKLILLTWVNSRPGQYLLQSTSQNLRQAHSLPPPQKILTPRSRSWCIIYLMQLRKCLNYQPKSILFSNNYKHFITQYEKIDWWRFTRGCLLFCNDAFTSDTLVCSPTTSIHCPGFLARY